MNTETKEILLKKITKDLKHYEEVVGELKKAKRKLVQELCDHVVEDEGFVHPHSGCPTEMLRCKICGKQF